MSLHCVEELCDVVNFSLSSFTSFSTSLPAENFDSDQTNLAEYRASPPNPFCIGTDVPFFSIERSEWFHNCCCEVGGYEGEVEEIGDSKWPVPREDRTTSEPIE